MSAFVKPPDTGALENPAYTHERMKVKKANDVFFLLQNNFGHTASSKGLGFGGDHTENSCSSATWVLNENVLLKGNSPNSLHLLHMQNEVWGKMISQVASNFNILWFCKVLRKGAPTHSALTYLYSLWYSSFMCAPNSQAVSATIGIWLHKGTPTKNLS